MLCFGVWQFLQVLWLCLRRWQFHLLYPWLNSRVLDGRTMGTMVSRSLSGPTTSESRCHAATYTTMKLAYRLTSALEESTGGSLLKQFCCHWPIISRRFVFRLRCNWKLALVLSIANPDIRLGGANLKGRDGFDSHSSHHVGTLGKSLTHSCLWRFSVKFRHSICAVSGALLSRSGLEEVL